jgi:mRNA interferase RelE/StbE
VPLFITERFARAYARLPSDVQTRVDKALQLLDEDFRHPSLRARRIEGTDGLYEARVDRRHRMTYHRDGDLLVLRNVGKHDQTLDRP